MLTPVLDEAVNSVRYKYDEPRRVCCTQYNNYLHYKLQLLPISLEVGVFDYTVVLFMPIRNKLINANPNN